MASMNAWPSVSIKRGGSPVISHKIVKCEWTDTLGAIIERVDPSLSHKKSATLIALFFSNQPTDPKLLSGMPVKQLLQLKWPNYYDFFVIHTCVHTINQE